jgi:Tfp pilus assembly protein PilO
MSPTNFKINTTAVKSTFHHFRQAISIVVLTIVMYLAWGFFVSPQYANFQRLQTASADLTAQLADVNQDLEQIERLYSQISETPLEAMTKLEKALPFSESLEEFLANMHRLAQQSGLVITNMYVRPYDGPQAQVGDIKRSQLNMSIRGNYIDLMYFLRLLERHVRLVDVNSITLRNVSIFVPGQNARSDVLQITITGDVYHLLEVPAAPLFPYGRTINSFLFDKQQFRELQILFFTLPSNPQSQPNPFAR